MERKVENRKTQLLSNTREQHCFIALRYNFTIQGYINVYEENNNKSYFCKFTSMIRQTIQKMKHTGNERECGKKYRFNAILEKYVFQVRGGEELRGNKESQPPHSVAKYF